MLVFSTDMVNSMAIVRSLGLGLGWLITFTHFFTIKDGLKYAKHCHEFCTMVKIVKKFAESSVFSPFLKWKGLKKPPTERGNT